MSIQGFLVILLVAYLVMTYDLIWNGGKRNERK